MKKMMKILAAALALLMALSVMTVSAFADEEPDEASGGYMPLGSTPYSIEVPAGFYDAGVSEEDIADDMISTFVADDSGLMFDVYEFVKGDKYPDVETFMTLDCEAYNGTELTLDGKINGVKMTSYRSNDEYNGITFNDMNYAFEYGEKIVQIDFYWQDPALDGMAEQIMSTFHMGGTRQIVIGLSGLSIMIPKDFAETDIAEEDFEKGVIGAYTNPYTGLEIESYYFENTADADLFVVAEAQAAAYNGTMLAEEEINGIPVAQYIATRTFDDVEYTVLVALVQAEDGAISAIAFYLNNYSAMVQADSYLGTLAYYDELKNVPMESVDMQIGSAGYKVTLPCGFITGYIPYDEFNEDGLLGAYVSPYSDLSFDVYQCLKANEEARDLAGFTELDAAKFNGTEIDLDVVINGIPMTSYRSVETYDEITYECLTYTFEAKESYFVQLCFYWVGEDLTEDAEQIMNSIAAVGTDNVAVAGGAYTVTVPNDTELTMYEDEENGVDTVFFSNESGLECFLVYHPVNTENLSAEALMAADCEQLGGTPLASGDNGNGVNVFTYGLDYSEAADEQMYGVIVTGFETNGSVYEMEIVIRSYANYEQAMAIIASLKAA